MIREALMNLKEEYNLVTTGKLPVDYLDVKVITVIIGKKIAMQIASAISTIEGLRGYISAQHSC